MVVKKSPMPEGLVIEALKRGRLTVRLIGETPMYYNAMSGKAQRSLLAGGGKKTAAERKEIKHDPEGEFRDSVYKIYSGPTHLGFPAAGVKGSMATAAIETAGVTKTSVQRLIFLPQEFVPIWGRPKLKMDIVRSADIAKTPDIRTRAFLPRWCAEVDIAFVTPTLSAHSVLSLLTNAGMIIGLGDFRQEKGRGAFGTFSVHSAEQMDDEAQERWDSITAEGTEVQKSALESPEPADENTHELMTWLRQERMRRSA
jgi:hypothetical protein